MNNLNERFMNVEMLYVEAWFDYHPEPQNIECFCFSNVFCDTITIFCADEIFDNYMIKLEHSTAMKALETENLVSELARIMNLTLIRSNRNLFLFTDKRL